AEGDSAGRARRSRPPRAADSARLRRQEHSHITTTERARAFDGDRRRRRSGACRMSTLTALRHRHLLGIADLEPGEIELILETALAMKEIGTRPIKKVPTLRGRTIINLFFESSTRTR